LLLPPSPKACDFGEMREFVIPPHCTQLGRARLRRGLSVRGISTPQGVTNWSPVFIIGEEHLVYGHITPKLF